MGQIYVTGDCHAEWSRFSTKAFPEQKEMTRDDFIIVCGDFGLWHDNETERYQLNQLAKRNFTLLFVDGNHENFDRLQSDEFPLVKFHGGYAHKIRENIYHLTRGSVYELCGKKIFTFGGARSHDIKDGILDEKDYKNQKELITDYNKRTKNGEMLRINHLSWWQEEMPSNDEMRKGMMKLDEHNYQVDYIITHCCPHHIEAIMSRGAYKGDKLTEYFDRISQVSDFTKWICGHYHTDTCLEDKFLIMHHQILRLI